jgi:hypothetical protein
LQDLLEDRSVDAIIDRQSAVVLDEPNGDGSHATYVSKPAPVADIVEAATAR